MYKCKERGCDRDTEYIGTYCLVHRCIVWGEDDETDRWIPRERAVEKRKKEIMEKYGEDGLKEWEKSQKSPKIYFPLE